MVNSSQFNPSRPPTKTFGQDAPFVPSQGRVGVPSQHPAIPAHKPVVTNVTPPKPYDQQRKG